MQLSTLIQRIDLLTLETLIGRKVLNIIGAESSSLQPSKLKEMVSQESSVKYIIDSQEKIVLLVGFLNAGERESLYTLLGVDSKDLDDEIRKLYSENKKEKVYAFFELPYFYPVEAVEYQSIELVEPKRGLRDYQVALLNKFKSAYNENSLSKVLLHLPTGSGKTRIAMRFLCDQLASRSTNFLWLANDNRLLRQAEEEFKQSWTAVGDTTSRIVRISRFTKEADLSSSFRSAYFCTIQSYYEMLKRNDPLFRNIAKVAKLIVFDEAHKITAPTYSAAVESLMYYSEAFLIGLSATPGRSTLEISEDRKLSEFFSNKKIKLSTEDFGFSNPFEFLISKKYLAKPLFTKMEYDIQKVTKLDFVFQKINEISSRYKKILVFCESIEETNDLGNALRMFNPNTYTVHSQNSDALNDLALQALREQGSGLSVIVLNAEMLTTGFDAPGIDCLVIAKTCNSIINFSQMVGRGLRGPASGGSEEVMIFHIQDSAETFYFDLEQMFNFWEGVWNE